MSFRIEPPQPCYGAHHANSGVSRPHADTNLWRSDPRQPLPQWLQLDWAEERRIAQVELTFPGHLFQEYHHYPPLYRDPQCPKEYGIEVWRNGRWEEAHRERGNYQRHRIHKLAEPVTTSRLRVVVHATNGDPSAAVYEIRCYSM